MLFPNKILQSGVCVCVYVCACVKTMKMNLHDLASSCLIVLFCIFHVHVRVVCVRPTVLAGTYDTVKCWSRILCLSSLNSAIPVFIISTQLLFTDTGTCQVFERFKKGEVHPITCHEDPEGSRVIVLL